MTGLVMDIIWPGAAGMMLGGFFFGGLWLTIRCFINRTHAGLWFSLSLLLRTVISCAGIYAIAAGSPLRLLFCAGGFMVARVLLSRAVGGGKGTYAYKS